jgi:hypothetical protein
LKKEEIPADGMKNFFQDVRSREGLQEILVREMEEGRQSYHMIVDRR